jgi:hypothetical protein
MSGPDEFDDFVARRRPLFPRPPDGLEPPAELDRLVLRQARDAIRPESPEPAYHGARWGMPVAVAASVLVAAGIVLHVFSKGPEPQVTVQNVAQQLEAPAAVSTGVPAAPGGRESPAWRGDARAWMAEIERLRAAGRTAEAEAELVEYRKSQRAYAGSPDR